MVFCLITYAQLKSCSLLLGSFCLGWLLINKKEIFHKPETVTCSGQTVAAATKYTLLVT